MKKGFTIIEIIISIGIILVVGTSVVFFTINKKDEKKELTNRILTAANLYLDVEIDDNGNTYRSGINLGGQGVVIPVKDLVDAGYVTSEDYELLSNSNAKVIAGYFEENECNEGEISLEASWLDDIDKTMYICSKTSNGGDPIYKKDIMKDMLDFYGGESKIFTDNNIYRDDYDYVEVWEADNGEAFMSEPIHKGILKRTEEDEEIYYFRGNVKNNYIKLSTFGELFRIVSFNEKSIKLISENVADLSGYEINSIEDFYNANNLDSHLSFIFDHYDEILNEENLIDNNYCIEDATSTKWVYYEDVDFSKTENCYSRKFGLLSGIESIYAGVFYDFSNSYRSLTKMHEAYDIPIGEDPSMGTGIWINDSYLSSGDSTHISAYCFDDYVGLFNNNVDVSIDIRSAAMLVRMPDYEGFDTNYVRVVFELLIDNLTFSGSGTQFDPYIIYAN